MLYSVIMAGGSGKRFWPKSRKKTPKQLLKIAGKDTMIIQTVKRVRKLCPPSRILVVTTKEQAPEIRRQLPQLPTANIVAEPFGRNTSACIGLAAVKVIKKDRNAVMAVMPADHVITPESKFLATLRAAAKDADRSSGLITFGIVPHFPATGYGYIKRSSKLAAIGGIPIFKVDSFTEKPNLAKAKKFLKSKRYYWNSGIFVWRADVILDEFAQYLPAHKKGLDTIKKAVGTRREARAIAAEYKKFKDISIDYGVMERSKKVRVIEAKYIWDDVGSWRAVERHFRKNRSGNVSTAENVSIDAGGNIIFADKLVATLGVDDLIIVDTPDAILVAKKERAEDVKKLVGELEKKKKHELL